MPCLVFDGWAAAPDTWTRCTFPRTRVFNYLEQLDGCPERAIAALDDVILVGFSMGGSMALRLFLAHPEKVRGLVLVSTSPCMMEKEGGWKGMSSRRFDALRLGTLMMHGNEASPLFSESSLDRGLAYLKSTDLRDALAACAAARNPSLPVCIFQSERDGIVRPNNAVFLQRVFPQAVLEWIPGNEHVLPLVIPEKIDEAVRICRESVGDLAGSSQTNLPTGGI